MRHDKSPIEQFKHEQTSLFTANPFKQSQFHIQQPKIDHSYILESYRKLRIQQRQQLAKLRIPDQMKKKIFDFKEGDNLKYQKPELVIFNHPFRGKMVLTKKQVQIQLQKERKNAQLISENKGQKIEQNILNFMGKQDQEIKVKKVKMRKEESSSSQQKSPKKQKASKYRSQKQIAEQLNKKQQKKRKDNIFYITKSKSKQQTQKEREQYYPQRRQQNQLKLGYPQFKQDKYKPLPSEFKTSSNIKQNSNKLNKFKDLPIIGQAPKVVRDIKFNEEPGKKQSNTISLGKKNYSKSKQKQKSEPGKGFYREFGNQQHIKELKKTPTKIRDIQTAKSIQCQDYRVESADSLLKKRNVEQNSSQLDKNEDKSMSIISAIASNDKEGMLSNSSIDKALLK